MARPQITLKLATSLDGKIALANGSSEWITCDMSRHTGRLLRAGHDAICVGSNTAHLDNPQLTTRIEGLSDPIRVVFDSAAKLSTASNLAQTAHEVPVIVFCKDDKSENAQALGVLGVCILKVPHNSDGLDVVAALDVLKRQGVNSLLIEGGGQLAASFVKAGVIDTIEWFRAPMILGADGRDAIGDLDLHLMGDAYSFDRVSVVEVDVDLRETYQKKAL